MSVASSPVRRRSPSDGGYLRGEETRRRIVTAALEVFAEEGFARASTRRIAAAAGVTPPALQYYFDSKEGLHRACADRIIEHVLAQLEPVLAAGRSAADSKSPDRALDAVCALVDVLADLSLTSEASPVWKRFIALAREDDAGGAYPRIKAAISQPMHAMAQTLVARATGGREEEDAVRLRTLLILGQLSTFHHNRDRAVQAVGWADLDGDRVSAIKRMVQDHTRASLLSARNMTSAGGAV